MNHEPYIVHSGRRYVYKFFFECRDYLLPLGTIQSVGYGSSMSTIQKMFVPLE